MNKKLEQNMLARLDSSKPKVFTLRKENLVDNLCRRIKQHYSLEQAKVGFS